MKRVPHATVGLANTSQGEAAFRIGQVASSDSRAWANVLTSSTSDPPVLLPAPMSNRNRRAPRHRTIARGAYVRGVLALKAERPRAGSLRPSDRGLRRALAADLPTLPSSAQVRAALRARPYDSAPWDRSSTGLRDSLGGWRPAPGPALPFSVHVWVGGDMARRLPRTIPCG